VKSRPRSKTCKTCGGERLEMVRTIARNGGSVVWIKCRDCEHNALGVGRSISHKNIKDIESLPIAVDLYSDSPVCMRCGKPGGEIHHWAPKHIFDDSGLWPTSLLCSECHQEWHIKMAAHGEQANCEYCASLARKGEQVE
jgi:hypothetical protein